MAALVAAALDTAPVPYEEILRAVESYRREVAWTIPPGLTRRQAERALKRLKMACYEVRKALDNLPDELQTFYSGPLRDAAADIGGEAGWRLYNVQLQCGKIRTGRRAGTSPRAQLEARVGHLLAKFGGRLSTYDPRRYPFPCGGQGKRGGRLAHILLVAYKAANIRPPSDLTPILRRVCRTEEEHARRRGASPLRRRTQDDPRRFLRE